MPPRLSARQEQCVRLTAFRTDKEIAALLGISEATVKKHVHEACQRLGVNRRKAALALLDQNGQGYPNDPMAEMARIVPDAAIQGDRDDGQIGRATSALELGRSGRGAGPDGVDRPEPSGARSSDPGAERRSIDSATDRASGVAPGDLDGPRTNAVPGYRAPPGGPIVRLILIAVLAVVISAMLVVVVGMVSDFHRVVDRFDPKSDQGLASGG